MPPPPRATYRLQFHRGFTFRDALELVLAVYESSRTGHPVTLGL